MLLTGTGLIARVTGDVSTLIEWDDEIPEWSVLAAEAQKARQVRDEVVGATGDAARRRPQVSGDAHRGPPRLVPLSNLGTGCFRRVNAV